MAKGVWRYSMNPQELKLWEDPGMKGWRAAMEAYVEDEARERGYLKYALIGRKSEVLAEKEVTKNTKEPAATA